MKVIPPITITDTMLTSSSVAETDYTVWATGSVYSTDTYVRVVSTNFHKVYKSLTGSTSTVTVTIAVPGVFTWNAHGLIVDTPIVFSTTGALPTGIVAGTVYYVSAPGTNTFSVAAAPGGTAITTTGAQSGVHTAIGSRNYGKDPTVAANTSTDGTSGYWQDMGATNRWRMFDLTRNFVTTGTSPMTVVITPGQRCDAIALTGLVADTAQITITSGGVTVYTVTRSLSTRNIYNWYDYFFQAFSSQADLAYFDLPPYTNAVITVTLTRTSGSISCGPMAIGLQQYIGSVEQSAVSDVLNFSTVTRDSSGNATLVPRRNVPKTEQKLFIEKKYVDNARAVRDSLNTTPAIWSGLDDNTDGYFESLFILGYYRQFSIDLTHPDYAKITLELEKI